MPFSPELDRTVPVVVLKLGRYVIHHGSLGVVRSLGRQGVPVYAIVEDGFTPVALSRYLTGSFVWRTPNRAPESLLADLGRIGKSLGRSILIATDDLAATFIAEQGANLAEWFLLPHVPKDLPRRLSNKRDLYFLCRSAGIPCAQTAFPGSVQDLHQFVKRATFPVVVKAAQSHRLPEGAPSTSIAWTAAELVSAYRKAERPGSPNIILQEYIPRSCGEDWIFHGYRNPATGCMLSFTGKKLRSWPPSAGPTTLGISAENEALIQQTEKLLRVTGYAGIMDLDYRLDKRDGQYKLLDFNPRIGANFRMFENSAGVDVVRALHLDLTGRKVPTLPAADNRVFIVEPYDFFSTLSNMLHNGLTPKAWFNSLHGRKEVAWFSWDDPLPVPAMCVRLAMRVFCGAARQRWIRSGNNQDQPDAPAEGVARGIPLVNPASPTEPVKVLRASASAGTVSGETRRL